ncbi:MAG TPA: hypothetical protein VGF97_02070 [Rhizomicrobium sp.]
MQYVFYRHRTDPSRELVLREGTPFPPRFPAREWYLHATHERVSERTQVDVSTLGYSEHCTGPAFGRKMPPRVHVNVMRRPNPF